LLDEIITASRCNVLSSYFVHDNSDITVNEMMRFEDKMLFSKTFGNLKHFMSDG